MKKELLLALVTESWNSILFSFGSARMTSTFVTSVLGGVDITILKTVTEYIRPVSNFVIVFQALEPYLSPQHTYQQMFPEINGDSILATSV